MSVNRRRLSLSIASGLLLEAINKISPLLILHHAQKYLGLVAFGWAQYGIASLEILMSLVAFGYVNYSMAEVGAAEDGQERARRILTPVIVLKAGHALLVILGCVLWQHYHQGRFSLRENAWLILYVLGSVTLEAYWFCIVNQKLATINLLGGLFRVASLLAILALVRDPSHATLFLCLMMLPNTLISISTGIYSFRSLGFSKPVWTEIKRIFIGSVPFAFIAIILILYDRFDFFLIERWYGLEALGGYSGPARVAQSLIMLIYSIVMAFYAEMIRLKDQELLFKHSSLSLWTLMTLTSPIAFGAAFVEKDAMKLLFTHSDPAAQGVFAVLAVGMIGNSLIAVFGLQLLQIKGHPWKLILALLLGLSVGPLAAYGLRESQGLLAASWAVLGTKALAASVTMIMARPLIGRIPWSSLYRPLLAGVVMALGLMLIQPEQLLLKLLLGAGIYLTVLIFMNREQIRSLLQHSRFQRIRQWFKFC